MRVIQVLIPYSDFDLKLLHTDTGLTSFGVRLDQFPVKVTGNNSVRPGIRKQQPAAVYGFYVKKLQVQENLGLRNILR